MDPLAERSAGFRDLTLGEGLLAVPPLILMLVLGVWPQVALEMINPTVLQWVERLKI